MKGNDPIEVCDNNLFENEVQRTHRQKFEFARCTTRRDVRIQNLECRATAKIRRKSSESRVVGQVPDAQNVTRNPTGGSITVTCLSQRHKTRQLTEDGRKQLEAIVGGKSSQHDNMSASRGGWSAEMPMQQSSQRF